MFFGKRTYRALKNSKKEEKEKEQRTLRVSCSGKKNTVLGGPVPQNH